MNSLNTSLTNLKKSMKNESFERLCWVMIMLDEPPDRLVLHFKIRASHRGVGDDVFFQDYLYHPSHAKVLRDALLRGNEDCDNAQLNKCLSLVDEIVAIDDGVRSVPTPMILSLEDD